MGSDEYDDDAFTEAANEAHNAIVSAWEAMREAGASREDIMEVIDNALAEAQA